MAELHVAFIALGIPADGSGPGRIPPVPLSAWKATNASGSSLRTCPGGVEGGRDAVNRPDLRIPHPSQVPYYYIAPSDGEGQFVQNKPNFRKDEVTLTDGQEMVYGKTRGKGRRKTKPIFPAGHGCPGEVQWRQAAESRGHLGNLVAHGGWAKSRPDVSATLRSARHDKPRKESS
jgi:hypothetical protein